MTVSALRQAATPGSTATTVVPFSGDLVDRRLLNDYQRRFPLEPRPFARIAQEIGIHEDQVIERLQRLTSQGCVSRVGVVFRPHRVGASTLAAMAVPANRLDAIVELVNRYGEVNHNYLRGHHWNLWFVVTADTEQRVQQVLGDIERRSGLPVLFLPMLEDYHIDLGFDLSWGAAATVERGNCDSLGEHRATTGVQMTARERSCLVSAIQEGFPLCARPYARIGQRCGLNEATVIAGILELARTGDIKRIGVVVRHHELGYHANAMAVWDVPDHRVTRLGHCIGEFEFVTLCYRRARHLPHWSYNLYCMVHGRDHEAVRGRIAEIVDHCRLDGLPHAVLFSEKRYKQRGARYQPAPAMTVA